MLLLPDKIKMTLEELKKEYKFFVSLKKINGKYYLYRQTTIWNKEKKKLKVISNYLGRIMEDGAFIRKTTTTQDELENAKAVILAHGGKIILPKIEEGNQLAITELTPDEIDQKILMTLSMNARTSLTFLGKQIGLTASATYNRVKQIEKNYGIRYLPEINTEKLGYSEFLVTAKFLEESPSIDELKNAFEKEPLIQLAMTTKGDYDILLYVLVKVSDDLKNLLIRVRSGAMSKYKSIWTCVSAYRSFGFIPLRNEFISLLKEDILEREYAVLKELNNDGVEEFTEIDKKYNFDKGRSQYSYHNLIEKGILGRVTVTLDNKFIKNIGIIFLVEVDSGKYEKNRDKLLTYIMKGMATPLDKFLYRANTVTPDGSVCIMRLGKDGDLEREVEEYEKLEIGVKTTTALSSGIIVGSVCLRVSDPAHSLQHTALVRDFGIKSMKKINYFETGRKNSSI